MTRAAALLALALAAAPAWSGDFELDVGAGWSLPKFQQTLRFDPSNSPPQVPGVTLQSSVPLELDAKGHLAFSGGLTWFFTGGLGLEGRVDAIGLELDSRGAFYDISVNAVRGVPSFSARLELDAENLKFENVYPVSLNLRLRTPGAVRLSVSGGLSYLSAIRFQGALVGRLSSTIPVPLPPVRVQLAAVAPPGEDRGQFGVNAGLGLQLGLGGAVSLQGDVRAFAFKKRTLTWSAVGVPSNVVEEALQQELLARLDPIQFDPVFWNATVGIALRF